METLYTRKRKTITNIETDEVKNFGSINLAKKESRRLQKQHGVLGCGVLVNLSVKKVRKHA